MCDTNRIQSKTIKTFKIKIMKLLKYALLAIPFLYFSCSDDDDVPEPINEEEVITTMTVTLVTVSYTHLTLPTTPYV